MCFVVDLNGLIGLSYHAKILRVNRHDTIGAKIHKQLSIVKFGRQDHPTQAIGALVTVQSMGGNKSTRGVNFKRVFRGGLASHAAKSLGPRT